MVAAMRREKGITARLYKIGWASGILRLQQQLRSVAMASFPLVSATGMLGSGFRAESLDKAISLGVPVLDEAGLRVLLDDGADAARAGAEAAKLDA